MDCDEYPTTIDVLESCFVEVSKLHVHFPLTVSYIISGLKILQTCTSTPFKTPR